MLQLFKEITTTIKLLNTSVKLINQSSNSEFKDFTIRTNQRKQLIVLDTKLRLARIHNARARRGL